MATSYMQSQNSLNQADTLRHNRAITTTSRGFKSAWGDVIDGARLWPLWGTLGWNEILQRYRRSTLGPFWLTASMAVMVIALGVLYAELFRQRIDDFIPFFCVGILAWNLIASYLTESGTLFTASESYIKQISLPFSVYVFRSGWAKLIIFAHNFVIYFGVLIYFRIWPGSVALLAVVGLLFVALNGACASLTIGMVSARFRDIPQVINSVVQILFFVTPVMWKPDALKGHAYITEYNPFFHLLQIVRAPLLGQLPTAANYMVVVLVTILNAALALYLFGRFRGRIAYWI
jgi:ABC-2 type transport system permease protein/lipopolysaccharide transport system permease protein